MGVVYEAVHVLLRKRVALKVMHADERPSQAALARFLREAESAARVRHPNVVEVVDVDVEGGVPFMVMELLEGEDLGRLLAREGALPAERAVDLVLGVLAALCAVHRVGIIHRDIKPENVFLATDDGGEVVPKLLDFGVSKDLLGAPANSDAIEGTPAYMAPEQIRVGAVDARTDQYGLGVLLYHCLAGVRPFRGDSLLELMLAIDSGECTPLRELAELPAGLASVIERAMFCDLERRYGSSEEFGRALLPYASERMREAYRREFEPPRRPSRPPPRWSDEELARCCANLLAPGVNADESTAAKASTNTFDLVSARPAAKRSQPRWRTVLSYAASGAGLGLALLSAAL